MADYIEGQLSEQFKSLDQELQDLILSEDTERAITQIAIPLSLSKDETDALLDETIITLLGSGPPNKFVENLEGRGFSAENARSAFKQVNDNIFSGVRSSIDNLYLSEPEEEISTLDKESILKDLEVPEASTTEEEAPRKILPGTDIEVPVSNEEPEETEKDIKSSFEERLDSFYSSDEAPTPPKPPNSGQTDPYREAI